MVEEQFMRHIIRYRLFMALSKIKKEHEIVCVNKNPVRPEDNALYVVNHYSVHDFPYACEAIGVHT